MMRPSISPLIVINEATPLRRYASSSMETSPMRVELCSVSARTASAALINGWINSIRMNSAPVSRCRGRHCVIAHHVLDDLIEDLGFDRLLYEMARTLLQSGHDVLLIADGGHHDDAGVRM